MLILAGVSLNAIVGDNGIITNAQNATILDSCAELSEFLNDTYIQNEIDKIESKNDDGTEKTALEKMLYYYPNYFFHNGSYDYVIVNYEHEDSSGNKKMDFLKLRLINKENLNDKLKKDLVGGNANGNDRNAYLNLQDVYGVTEDLDVFYCSNGIASVVGANYTNSGFLDGSKIAYKKDSGVSKVISETLGTETSDISISEARSINNLNISGDSGIDNLNFLIDMPNITKLTFTNYKGNLNGLDNIPNLYYIYFDNSNGSTEIDYTGLRNSVNLTELYFFKPTDEEVRKLCEEMSLSSYTKLETLGFYGRLDRSVNDFFYSKDNTNWGGNLSLLTTVEKLDLLNQDTKDAVKVLYVNNNKLTNLKGIENFRNVNSLFLNNNQITNSTDEITGETIYGMSSYIKNMTELVNLFFGWNQNLKNEDFENISVNSKIRTLSMAGCTSISDLSVITSLNELKYLMAYSNSNFNLTSEILQKISKLNSYYFDNKYATAISLSNIGGEVYLSTDVSESDFLLLKDKSQINTLEIGGCRNISDSALQNVLGSLTGLVRLYADDTNLNSFNFVKSGSKLSFISVMSTSIKNLDNLNNCSNLRSLRIDTSGLNLKPYSKMISKMCSRGHQSENHLKCGSYSEGGINTSPAILNTLNGTADNPNLDFTYFSSYCGFGNDMALVDFTNTGLERIGIMYQAITIRVPACYKIFSASECAVAKIDYTNLISADSYYSCQVSSSNYDNFLGYKSVQSGSYPLSIIGENTEKLDLGNILQMWGQRNPGLDYNLKDIVSKAPNLNYLSIGFIKGITDISCFESLKLNTLILNTCTGGDINVTNELSNNLSENLTSLSIVNCGLANLNGLNNLNKITNLNLQNNMLENYVTVIINGEKRTLNTCEFIVSSLPELKTVYLSQNTDLTDFSGLINAGFKDDGNHNFSK